MRLLELFTLLELKDRISATAEKYQRKLIRRFTTAAEEGKLRGGGIAALKKKLEDPEQHEEAAKEMVEHFASGDPSQNNKYTDWIVRQFIKGHLMWEDAARMRNLLSSFEEHRKNLDKKDLNHYSTYQELEKALEPHKGTKAAGVRVKNFMARAELQKFMGNPVPNPDNKDLHDDFRRVYDPDHAEDPDSIPDWFRNSMEEDAEQYVDHSSEFESENFWEAAKEEVDPDDYMTMNDEDEEELDEDAYEEAVQEKAEQLADEARNEYARDYVNNNIEEQWRDYVEENKHEMESSLLSQIDRKNPTNELEVYWTNDRMVVFVPNSQEASCYLGKGTEWCTAAEASDNYFWEYRLDGPLYTILTDKLGKFQFHFESNQFMDEHDHYLEASSALKDLNRLYSNELQQAFGDKAREFFQLWMLDPSQITEQDWQRNLELATTPAGNEAQALRQSTFPEQASYNAEDSHRVVIRLYQAHAEHAPPGWAEAVKEGLSGGESGKHSYNEKWFGTLSPEETSAAIIRGIDHINALDTARQLVKDGLADDISEDAWHALILKGSNSMFYAPMKYLNRKLIDRGLEQDAEHVTQRKAQPSTHFSHQSFLRKFHGGKENVYRGLKNPQLKDEAQGMIPKIEHIESLLTKNDFLADVDGFPENLREYGTEYGMDLWDRVYQRAVQSFKQGDERAFVKLANLVNNVIANSDDEAEKKALATYLHKILDHDQTYTYHMRGTTQMVPPKTQGKIVQHAADMPNDWNRRRHIEDMLRHLDGLIAPETEEALRYIAAYSGNEPISQSPQFDNVIKMMEPVFR